MIRGKNSDGKMNGESKDRARIGGINAFSSRRFTREYSRTKRLGVIRLEITDVSWIGNSNSTMDKLGNLFQR